MAQAYEHRQGQGAGRLGQGLRLLRCGLAGAALLVLAGCGTLINGHPEPVVDTAKELLLLEDTLSAKAVVACIQQPSTDCRNSVLSTRMYAADLRFAQFERQLFKEGRQAMFGSALATLGLSAAATASTGGTAQALSALNTLILGGRESYQKDLLSERTSIALHTAMRARRAELALRLRVGLSSSLADYPVALALAEVEQYRAAGTVLGALVTLTEAVGSEARQAQSKLSDYAQRGDAARQIQRLGCKGKETCSADELDPAVISRLTACVKAAGLTPADKPMRDFFDLVRGGDRFDAQARAAVLACLDKPEPKAEAKPEAKPETKPESKP